MFLCTVVALSPVSHAADGAANLFKEYQGRIFQIRIMDVVAGKKSGLGSGFLVSADGLIATNYHVVSKWVNKPDKYRLEYQDVAGNVNDLTLVDVDVINDLALVMAQPVDRNAPDKQLQRNESDNGGAQDKASEEKGLADKQAAIAIANEAADEVGALSAKPAHSEPFGFPEQMPAQGDTIYSIGNPYDIGFTVVPGTYNGIADNTYYKRIHFSGSINPGMSGGPVLNADGQVVGVNVSSAGNQISFLVPGTALQRLIAQTQARETPLDSFDQRIHQQLQDNQDRLISEFLAREWTTQKLSEATVLGEMDPFVKCWGGSNDEKDLFKSISTACRSNESVYLNDRFNSGVISYQFFWLEAGELNNARFQNYYQSLFRRFQPDNRANEDDVGNYVCDEKFVRDANDNKDKLVICVRAYIKYQGLYDVLYLRGSIDLHDRAFVSHFTLAGVDRQNMDAFLNRFMEVIER